MRISDWSSDVCSSDLASFSIAVIISFVGGRPGMISAATAAIAVLIVPLVRNYGVDYLFAATILMGLLQVLAGFLSLDLIMQYVSRSVVTGFVNALAKIGRASCRERVCQYV